MPYKRDGTEWKRQHFIGSYCISYPHTHLVWKVYLSSICDEDLSYFNMTTLTSTTEWSFSTLQDIDTHVHVLQACVYIGTHTHTNTLYVI